MVALLTAFDDVEELLIEDNWCYPMHSPQVLLSALRFPSLRQLTLGNVVVQSMDVFDPSVPVERVPTKPALEVLDLRNIVVRDSASLYPFITKLSPTSAHPNPMLTTLRCLVLDQKNRTFHNGALFDRDLMATVYATLQNSTLEFVQFTFDSDDELAEK